MSEASVMNKRICRKCLLRDLEGREGKDYVAKYVDVLSPEDKAEDALYEQRLAACKECEHLLEAMCNACGCYVEFRAAAKKAKCPYKKW